MNIHLYIAMAQITFFCAMAGIIGGLFAYRRAHRRDLIFAFIIYMLGEALRNATTWSAGGPVNGPVQIEMFSASRIISLIGTLLFIRAATKESCGELCWVVVLLATVTFAFAIHSLTGAP